jgi:hypothetical protein
MLVTIDSLKPGDKFVELDPDPRLDVEFVVQSKDCFGDIIAEDEFGYKFTFRPTKIVRICQ